MNKCLSLARLHFNYDHCETVGEFNLMKKKKKQMKNEKRKTKNLFVVIA